MKIEWVTLIAAGNAMAVALRHCIERLERTGTPCAAETAKLRKWQKRLDAWCQVCELPNLQNPDFIKLDERAGHEQRRRDR